MNNLNKYFLLTLIVGLIQVQSSFAQFGVGLGASAGIPMGDFGDLAEFGAGFHVEPKYLINGKIATGVSFGGLFFGGADVTELGGGLNATTVVPITAFGEYMFSDSKVTPYVGLAVGPYFISGGEIEIDFGGLGSLEADLNRTEFGFAPRAGVYIGKFNLGAAYHIVNQGSFLSFKLGVDIGAHRNY